MSGNLRRDAEAALAEGDFETARARLMDAVRAAPGDPFLRAFLFQFSALAGDWSRASKQLDILGKLKPEALDLVHDYRVAIAAEAVREAVWAGQMSPPVFGKPRPWIAKMTQALREPDYRADALRREALEEAPALSGSLNDETFEWIGDSDNRLGPAFELMINGEYHWMSFEDVAVLECEPPSDLRDYVWTLGLLTIATGATLPVMIPSRYPGAATAEDPSLRAGRKSAWRELPGGLEAGYGQRVLAMDQRDAALLDIRRLAFDHGATAALAGLRDAADE